MSRFDIATGRVPVVSPQLQPKEKPLIEKLDSLSEWYDQNHFQQLIEELREYCKSISQINIEKIHKRVWSTRISVFDSYFTMFFRVHPDYGMVFISHRGLSREPNIVFRIEKTGQLIDADPNKSRAEIIMTRLLEEALPVGPIEEIKAASDRTFLQEESGEISIREEMNEEDPTEERLVLPAPDRLNENEPIIINCTTNISEQTPNEQTNGQV